MRRGASMSVNMATPIATAVAPQAMNSSTSSPRRDAAHADDGHVEGGGDLGDQAQCDRLDRRAAQPAGAVTEERPQRLAGR